MKFIKKIILSIFLFFCAFAVYSQDAVALRESFVAEAKKYVGVPYLWGGTTTEGMDCSGYIYTSSRNSVGVQLPRTVAAMYDYMRIVNDSKKESGDILFFKTVGNTISHAGIYIGNNQFIHSASDGPNTGVIVSSLNQTTWKNTYAGVGQFLPPANTVEVLPSTPSNESSVTTTPQASTTTNTSFKNDITLDFSGAMLWNFYTTDSFLFNVRGASLLAHAKYTGWEVQPGFGIEIRIEPRMDMVQIPLHFSISVPYGFRVYAGPVFTIGSPKLIGSGEKIRASIFPGIMGLSWQSPSFEIGKTDISFIQDIAWTVFNNPDNSALTIGKSFVAGLVFSTGFRVSLDASSFIQ